jgi:hypothetical protein
MISEKVPADKSPIKSGGMKKENNVFLKET